MNRHSILHARASNQPGSSLKLLAGLIRPSQGRITTGWVEVDTSALSWRKQTGIVSQDSIFFNRTIRENLLYGAPEGTTDDDILKALEQVNMKHRILKLPAGLDTVIMQSGDEFSGGQRQRLQICRLLLHPCPVVLLDECTSALDAETTEDILKVLKEFLVDKTLVMVTHDIQTLQLAERVLNMRVGGMMEDVTDKMISDHLAV